MKLLRKFKKLKKDDRGNFSIMLSLTVFLAISAMGMVVDHSFMSSRITKLQGFADSAVLAAAISQNRDEAELRKIAEAHIKESNLEGFDVEFTLELKGNLIYIETRNTYPTMVMGMMGYKSFDLAATAAAPLLEVSSAHIALVLDRTASMDKAGNMPPLKNAATKMIDSLEESGGDVKLSVVPFSDYVNVGVERRSETWADVEDDDWREEKVCSEKQDVTKTYNCRMETRTRYYDGYTYKEKVEVCDYEYGEPYESCEEKWVGDRWRGCMGSRDDPYNLAAKYGGKRIKGIMNKWCGQELLPMTDDLEAVKKSVDRLSGSGKTYMPAGLIWGWRTLDPGEPFTEASTGFDPATRALVLMTDGQNTLTQDDEFHVTEDKTRPISETDERTVKLCEIIKQEKIVIYSVAYNFPGDAAVGKKILNICASDSTKFFDAKSADELEEAFKNIGKDLARVRLSE